MIWASLLQIVMGHICLECIKFKLCDNFLNKNNHVYIKRGKNKLTVLSKLT